MCPQYTRAAESYQSILNPFLPYLEQQWQAGCTNATQLYREISVQGFAGSRGVVSNWALQQRPLLPVATRYARQQPEQIQPLLRKQKKPRALSAAAASWLIVKEPDSMDLEEATTRMRLIAADEQVSQLANLAQRFGEMVRQRHSESLHTWLTDATCSGMGAIISFVNGLRADLMAVTNALSLPWSQGQVEGQVNRLKTLKRQMYGRANFDLLRLRVLHRTG